MGVGRTKFKLARLIVKAYAAKGIAVVCDPNKLRRNFDSTVYTDIACWRGQINIGSAYGPSREVCSWEPMTALCRSDHVITILNIEDQFQNELC